MNFILRKWVK